MDRKALVKTLTDLFLDSKKVDNLIVDAIGLAPAYFGLVKNRYILGISAPSLAGQHQYEKANLIVDILFAYCSDDVRRMIDRVRVYDSKEELQSHAHNDFEIDYSDARDAATNPSTQIYELTH